MKIPAHRVVQREVIDWANSLNGKPPSGDDLSRLIEELAKAVEADRSAEGIKLWWQRGRSPAGETRRS